MGKSAGQQIYVEIPIRADLDRLWQLSQDPSLHPRWDLRFTAIRPVDEGAPNKAQHFRYEFRLPLHTIHGTGTSLGTRLSAEGHATSVLKFTTSDLLSPIGTGAGYWRYLPFDGGIRFVTGYNYQPGWGALGQFLDAPLVRPALGWATAVSFDRLRLWAEQDLDPAAARNAWLADAAARAAGAGAALILMAAAAGRPRRPGSLLALMTGAAVLTVVVRTPANPRVPRAARCLRTPAGRASRAPSDLATLPEPA
ncbi:hypothetical protein ABIB35_002289 [Arthrobacter sp. UYP6]|uniref:hypothetical protein n=1 Tax=Arthrobacter sp. UYP6 TaxID=1756378 RepID=UPI003391F268